MSNQPTRVHKKNPKLKNTEMTYSTLCPKRPSNTVRAIIGGRITTQNDTFPIAYGNINKLIYVNNLIHAKDIPAHVQRMDECWLIVEEEE